MKNSIHYKANTHKKYFHFLRQGIRHINKSAPSKYKLTFFVDWEDYAKDREIYKNNFKNTLKNKTKCFYLKFKDKSDYKNYNNKDYALLIELLHYFTIEEVSEILNIPKPIIKQIMYREGLDEIKEWEKPPIIVWIPRIFWQKVDVINLKYDRSWLKDLKKVFINTISKIRSKKHIC